MRDIDHFYILVSNRQNPKEREPCKLYSIACSNDFGISFLVHWQIKYISIDDTKDPVKFIKTITAIYIIPGISRLLWDVPH